MQTPTRSKTNGLTQNHTPTLVRPTGLKVKTHVQAGSMPVNHSQTLVRAR
jgi:hypothetical protein